MACWRISETAGGTFGIVHEEHGVVFDCGVTRNVTLDMIVDWILYGEHRRSKFGDLLILPDLSRGFWLEREDQPPICDRPPAGTPPPRRLDA